MAQIRVIDQNRRDLGNRNVHIKSDAESRPTLVRIGAWDVYGPTGKTGTSLKDGRAMIEMATVEDKRLWITADLVHEPRIELD